MKAATIEFLKQRFREYYKGAYLSAPPSVEQREWGFVFFEADYPEIRMRRHIGFGSPQELFEYAKAMVPAHAYYSSAYYATPGAPTMATKGWLGADLIFDLDADHIMRGPYDLMLARVKQECEKLIGMLTDELGFSKREIALVFSGGRGYHIHIREIAVRGWGSAERREIIDYVCGIGIDPGVMLSMRSHSPRGWHQRYISSLHEYLVWLKGMENEEAISRLSALEGVGKVSAEEFMKRSGELVRLLESDPAAINLRDRTVGKVIWALFQDKESDFLARIREQAALADEPVTTDTKRLIRMPGSLHGGSGFRVTPLVADELEDFNPLVDAVVFGTREVGVDMAKGLSVPLLGNTYTLEAGKNSVPEALAVFLCCRGMAEIAGGRRDAS
ncbi:MAG TPA: DNA primase catalytic subunit PriS [Methanoregulaceae archaeon]|nr:DNA primase catalytic subunit PriS [Methanoregulaceae archaeon]